MPARSAAERVRNHRADMRAQGFKLVQRWVPDTDSPALQDAILRSVAIIAAQDEERAILAWMEDMSAWDMMPEAPEPDVPMP